MHGNAVNNRMNSSLKASFKNNYCAFAIKKDIQSRVLTTEFIFAFSFSY